MPAPTCVLARAAWMIPTLVLWHANGRFTRVEEGSVRELRGGAGRELAATTFVQLTRRRAKCQDAHSHGDIVVGDASPGSCRQQPPALCGIERVSIGGCQSS